MTPKPTPLARPEDVEARVGQLRAAMLDKLTPQAVGDVMAALIERAKRGDLQAVRMVLGYVAPNASLVAPRSDGASVAVLRRLAALFLLAHKSATPAALAAQLEVDANDLGAVMGCELFQRDALGWTLTPAGRPAGGPSANA